ncbi:hypothetical protein VT50_0228725 [Streptomyces antioxidans]|uniref:Uncharacterized protein n=1 Tax=Streptomyces antioxidans TaxID=1507734 RepID=A0A1V4CY38_9ACTN|nr:hypothetical protein [Streptomyces antioxidans]OPF73399.1 hypothetical protein VT50_0228725 [Streptomyces antioxidans]
MRWRPSAPALALALVLALAVVLPLGPSLPTASARTSAGTPIVFDDGPRHRCYAVQEEHYDPEPPGHAPNPLKDTSGCSALDDPQRVDAACADFGHTGPWGPACPAWKFLTVGWYYQKTPDPDSGDFRKFPGYDVQVAGAEGAPLTVSLRNSARATADPCTLREVAFAYEYPSSSFRRRADGGAYGLADGSALRVSYDARVSDGGVYACASEHRASLTTDLIYGYGPEGARKKNVISVVHFNPDAPAPPPDGVLWRHCDTGGCRVAVAAPEQLPAGVSSHISVEFRALAQRYAADLGHPDGVPADAQIDAVQIVSSNRGTDTGVDLTGTEVVLE